MCSFHGASKCSGFAYSFWTGWDLGLTRTMFTNKVFTNSVHGHHPNTNTNMNMFTNMDNPGVALVNPYILIN